MHTSDEDIKLRGKDLKGLTLSCYQCHEHADHFQSGLTELAAMILKCKTVSGGNIVYNDMVGSSNRWKGLF